MEQYELSRELAQAPQVYFPYSAKSENFLFVVNDCDYRASS